MAWIWQHVACPSFVSLYLGCPRNNFFSFPTEKKIEIKSVWLIFGLFRETNKRFFRLVSVFRANKNK
jgi:hypothetical protein